MLHRLVLNYDDKMLLVQDSCSNNKSLLYNVYIMEKYLPLNFDLMFANSLLILFISASLLLPKRKKTTLLFIWHIVGIRHLYSANHNLSYTWHYSRSKSANHSAYAKFWLQSTLSQYISEKKNTQKNNIQLRDRRTLLYYTATPLYRDKQYI
jgi:hypothetical protein